MSCRCECGHLVSPAASICVSCGQWQGLVRNQHTPAQAGKTLVTEKTDSNRHTPAQTGKTSVTDA